MARTRSIRPGFFTNDSLGELPPVVRLLFAGLWTVADRDGRLLDRPRKLKAELLAYDNVNVDKALDQLAGAGFIERYQAGDEHCIQIHNWLRHQRPHPLEARSVVPAPEGQPGSTPEVNLEEDLGAPAIAAESRPNPPGTLSSSSWSSSSSSSGTYHPLRGEDPPTPLPDETSEEDQDAPPGSATCPECELLIDRNGDGHGLCKRPDCENGTRVHNCSLDHLKPHEWPMEVVSA